MATLKNVFEYTDAKLTMTAMAAAGFAKDEIADAAKDVFNASTKMVEGWGKEIDKTFKDLFRGI